MKSIFITASLAGFAQAANGFQPGALFRQMSHGSSIYHFPGAARSKSSHSEPGAAKSSSGKSVDIRENMKQVFINRIKLLQEIQKEGAGNENRRLLSFLACDLEVEQLMNDLCSQGKRSEDVNRTAEELSKKALKELNLAVKIIYKPACSARTLNIYKNSTFCEAVTARTIQSRSDHEFAFTLKLPQVADGDLEEYLGSDLFAEVAQYRKDIHFVQKEIKIIEARLKKRYAIFDKKGGDLYTRLRIALAKKKKVAQKKIDDEADAIKLAEVEYRQKVLEMEKLALERDEEILNEMLAREAARKQHDEEQRQLADKIRKFEMEMKLKQSQTGAM